MNILVVGFGSIGRRHVSNLVADPRVAKVFVQSRRAPGLADRVARHKKVQFVRRTPRISLDFAMICNETGRHMATAVPLAARGVPLFIEKPLAVHPREARLLQIWTEKKKIPIYVAYNLRFLGALNVLKRWITRGTLGRLCFARIEAGQLLPDWRPGRNWRLSYSALPRKGGGVGLDLSHEIDYIRWVFGDPKRQCGMTTSAGDLGIRSDTVFEAVYEYPSGFLCSLHLDYLQKPAQRRIRVIGTQGTVDMDLLGQKIRLDKKDGRSVILTEKRLFDVGKTYVDELRYFIGCLKSGRIPCPGLGDGVRVLEMLDV